MTAPRTRRQFPTLTAALADFGVPQENWPKIQEIVADLDLAQFWIPPSRAHISTAGATGPIKAYIGKGSIDIPQPGGEPLRHWLPVNSPNPSGPRAAVRELPVQVCPAHHMQLPANGQCEDCE
ncbi:hypothetical protein [Cellulomonas bogoriensis]|uniref:Uncharacterized protein n=1 Tax=Cellulomonas bogoriensis 69B4 = DSM 16987 TaxID=1386082 RepID=A0A0A0BWX2_9CELL|nr:hypothetical protein [Cellulomonas bogoriensis]KGM12893.1 hypothetical protein N869_01065 [Cellulomonas bogoriensis 69B4 = DSM 16987]